MTSKAWGIVVGCFALACASVPALGHGTSLAPPEIEGCWVRPSSQQPAQPVWGHAAGLRIGLWPMPGPRGLLRVYTPYLGHDEERMINYIAIEPVVLGEGVRSFSELERSQVDGVVGLQLWSADTPDAQGPLDPTNPARGVIAQVGDVETLSVFILIEPYRSGAIVALCLTFRADRPYEVGVSTMVREGSKPLAACIVTATMGNYARLRTLHLRDGTREAVGFWPTFSGSDFAPRVCFTLDQMIVGEEGHVLFMATPDEARPEEAIYLPRTSIDWRYYGDSAMQSWRSEDPHPLIRGCVNGRTEYWASRTPIPGGIAFENFEMIEPFRNGATFWFGVTPSQAGNSLIDCLVESGSKQDPSYISP